MIIVKMDGGLGNQMFIYAFAKNLESKGYEVNIDATWYNDIANTRPQSPHDTNHITIRNLEIHLYNLTLPLLYNFDDDMFFMQHDRFYTLRKNLNTILPKPFRMSNYRFSIKDNKNLCKKMQEEHPKFPKNAYFAGFFQSLSCIQGQGVYTALLHDFTLKKPLNDKNQQIKNHILNTEDSVFLHIRRGDYLTHERYIHLSQKYYNNCLAKIKSELRLPHIFIFSNDIAWCKNHFLQNLDSTCTKNIPFNFIDHNDESNAVEEMELMRSCKHAIIANSTFSWWAAYLLQNPNKIVLAPSKFLHDSTYTRMKDLYPQTWTMIECE